MWSANWGIAISSTSPATEIQTSNIHEKSLYTLPTAPTASPKKLTIEGLAAIDLPETQLASLSACSTAENKTMDLVDENLHIAAAFQLVGFPQVIGTLLEAQDWAARKTVSKFYAIVKEEIAKGWEVAPSFFWALHQAVSRRSSRG